MFRIERDETLIAQLIALEQQFWGYVEQDQPPPADGSASAELALRCLYTPGTAETRWTSLGTLRCLGCSLTCWQCGRYSPPRPPWRPNSSSAFSNAWERPRGRCSRRGVSWKRSKDSASLDTAQLLKDHPEMAQTYQITKPEAAGSWCSHRNVGPGQGRHLGFIPQQRASPEWWGPLC